MFPRDVPLTAAHTAMLCFETGQGFLICPNPRHDLYVNSGESLHTADGKAALTKLARMGFQLSLGDDGEPILEGVDRDGHPVIGLYSDESILSDPSFDDFLNASDELARLCGIA